MVALLLNYYIIQVIILIQCDSKIFYFFYKLFLFARPIYYVVMNEKTPTTT